MRPPSASKKGAAPPPPRFSTLRWAAAGRGDTRARTAIWGGGGQQRVEKKRPRKRRCTTMKKKNNEMMTIRRRTQTTAPTASDATPARLSLSLSNHYYTPSPTLYLSLCPLLLSQDGRRCSNCTGRTTFCIIHAFCFQLAPCSCGRNACHAHHHALLNK